MANHSTILEEMSLDEMLDLKDEIDLRVEKLASEERQELQSRISRLQGVIETKPTGRVAVSPRQVPKKAATKPTGKRGPKKGQKVAAKYRDPDTGNSWTGRGLTPIWLREHEAAGRHRDEFEV